MAPAGIGVGVTHSTAYIACRHKPDYGKSSYGDLFVEIHL
jgi:hypothetical protein